MDPITATLLVVAAIGITSRAVGGGVAHAAAAVRGKPSPVVQKWEAREKANVVRGEKSRTRPGIVRTVLDNGVAEWTERQQHKHAGRMDAIRAMSPDIQGKARNRVIRRAERRASLAGTVATWSFQSKEGLQRAANEVREVLDERRADRAARRAAAEPAQPGTDRQQQAAEAIADLNNATSGQDGDGADAEVIPFRHPNRESSEEQPVENTEEEASGETDDETDTLWHDVRVHMPADGLNQAKTFVDAIPGRDAEEAMRNARQNWITHTSFTQAEQIDYLGPHTADFDQDAGTENTEMHGGTDMSTPTATNQQQVPEITDLASGIQYADIVGGHMGKLGAKFGDDATILANNAKALSEQAQQIEDGQAALASLGFEGGQIQTSLAEAGELVPTAAQDLQVVAEKMPAIAEQLEQVATAMSRVKSALEQQRNLAEQVQSHAASNGVAKNTAFYQEA